MSIEQNAPTLCAAFRTTVASGGEYTMVFRFPSIEAMDAADREWHALRNVRTDAQRELVEALEKLLNRYTELVNCGDCGFWDPETEDEVKQARATLARVRGESHG